ncbi:MAG: (2Fe-2S)-binding protein, partial [Candidatus Izemoplasmatales bacterium]
VEKIKFNELSIEEKKDLIKKDARYGKIICKCEKITEKEIIDAINGPLGSKTIKGIKKRTRSGAGLCQGGYCEEKIVKILINNFGLKPLDILYDKEESNLFVSETKVEV